MPLTNLETWMAFNSLSQMCIQGSARISLLFTCMFDGLVYQNIRFYSYKWTALGLAIPVLLLQQWIILGENSWVRCWCRTEGKCHSECWECLGAGLSPDEHVTVTWPSLAHLHGHVTFLWPETKFIIGILQGRVNCLQHFLKMAYRII